MSGRAQGLLGEVVICGAGHVFRRTLSHQEGSDSSLKKRKEADHVQTDAPRVTTFQYGWLFINVLDTTANVRRLFEFYVQQHNQVMPHWALKKSTPDEVYFGTGVGILERLEKEHAQAQEARLKVNQGSTCETCETGVIDNGAGVTSVEGPAV